MSFKFWKKRRKGVMEERSGASVTAAATEASNVRAEPSMAGTSTAMSEEDKLRQRRRNMLFLSASKIVQEQREGNRGTDLLSSHWDAVNRDLRHYSANLVAESAPPLPPEQQSPVSELHRSIPPIKDDDDNDLRMYQYRSLPTATSIRVVELISIPEPDDSDSNIVCHIHTVNLRDEPDYAALSYTWGLPQLLYPLASEKSDLAHEYELCCPIVCNGATLMVTRNLSSALRALRVNGLRGVIEQQIKTKPPQFLWIDAICINQEDRSERNAQVEMMGSIYQSARLVMVWLGPNNWYAGLAIRCFNAIIAIARRYGQTNLSHVDITGAEWWRAQNIDAYLEDRTGRPDWEALYVYLQHTWFRRAWIVQEIAFAREAIMLCGDTIINWDLFAKCCEYLKYHTWNVQLERVGRVLIDGVSRSDMAVRMVLPGIMAPEVFRSLHYFVKGQRVDLPFPAINTVGTLRASLRRTSRAANDTHPGILRELLELCRPFVATDDKDKVYAFMSVAEAMLEATRVPIDRPLRISYQRSTQDIFTETIQYILSSMEPLKSITDRMGRNTEILWQLEDKAFSKLRDLPSWVPDLSVSCLPIPFGDEIARQWNVWPLEFRLSYPPVVEGNKLYSQGILLDVIVDVASLEGDFLANAVQVAKDLPAVYRQAEQFTPVRDTKERFKQIMEELTSDDFELAMVGSQLSVRGLSTAPTMNSSIEDVKDDNLDDPEVKAMKAQIGGIVPHQASPRPQSSMEVLWRTLLLDFSQQVPASLTVGFAFGDWIVRRIEEAYMSWIMRRNELTMHDLEAAVQIFCELDASQPSTYAAGVMWPATSADAIEELRSYTRVDYFAGMSASMQKASQRSGVPYDEAASQMAAEIYRQEAESLAPIRFLPTWGQAKMYLLRSALPEIARDRIARRQVSFFEQYNRYNPGRRVFRTQNGWFGNGHQSARPGDQVWYLALCSVLFILRPIVPSDHTVDGTEEVQRRFTMIGACYVHGLMHREGGFEQNEDVVQSIVIE